MVAAKQGRENPWENPTWTDDRAMTVAKQCFMCNGCGWVLNFERPDLSDELALQPCPAPECLRSGQKIETFDIHLGNFKRGVKVKGTQILASLFSGGAAKRDSDSKDSELQARERIEGKPETKAEAIKKANEKAANGIPANGQVYFAGEPLVDEIGNPIYDGLPVGWELLKETDSDGIERTYRVSKRKNGSVRDKILLRRFDPGDGTYGYPTDAEEIYSSPPSQITVHSVGGELLDADGNSYFLDNRGNAHPRRNSARYA